jgi:hypothetical protein
MLKSYLLNTTVKLLSPLLLQDRLLELMGPCIHVRAFKLFGSHLQPEENSALYVLISKLLLSLAFL